MADGALEAGRGVVSVRRAPSVAEVVIGLRGGDGTRNERAVGEASSAVAAQWDGRGKLRGPRGSRARATEVVGEFENPAAVAAVYESLQRVLAKYPALGKRYAAGFRNGLNPVQTMFYIDEDQDLARALDEDAAEQAGGLGSDVERY